MNIILFEPAETTAPLPRSDPRARHLVEVLRRRAGDTFDAGLINGPRGKGAIGAIGSEAITIGFTWNDALPPPLDPITLVIGLPRPQTARKILHESAALGAARLHFVTTEKGEPNYAASTLWRSGEWRRHLLAGVAQSFDTRVPEVVCGGSLADAITLLPHAGCRIALDNYEAAGPLSQVAATAPVVLALGPERGWSAAERAVLRETGFILAHLGARVLRTETAVVAALALVKAKLGSL